MNEPNLDPQNLAGQDASEPSSDAQAQENKVEDIADFYLPCLLAVLHHLDRSMTESALRSRVSDPEELGIGWWSWTLCRA